ncbi:hypothetical protein RRF57_006815 [Xylaria bambusicola]|uniref:Glycosyltransferase 2-like domain-containing protein n=1 Tax=Xylaria bambusicola TaxID=326684 RepID=A0AAN7YZ90_9PEZI
MFSVAYFILLEDFFRGLVERRLMHQYISQYTPFPLPSPSSRLFNTSDVSIIVPTVGFEPSQFSRALISWLSNKPLEVIVVTTHRECTRTQALLNSEPIQAAVNETGLRLLTVAVANKRTQLVCGINEAKGRIIALVDDDAFWIQEILINLLAPFQVEDVGLVGGPIESYVPSERKDSAVITGWEVAALRARSKREGGNKAFYMRDGSTNFTVSGATMLLRSEILKEPVFQTEFTGETFMGQRMNSGDDSFITRWMLFQHLREDRKGGAKWRLGMQITPEATVFTALIPDRKFAEQMKRWLRTGLRFRLMCLLSDPGLRNFWRTTPYMCRKMVEAMFNPLLTLVWYLCYFKIFRAHPLAALLIALYYFYGLVSSYVAFGRQFPYARNKIWAAILLDRFAMVSDWYSWATLAQENWASRKGVDVETGEICCR